MSGMIRNPNFVFGDLLVAGGDVVIDNDQAYRAKLSAGTPVDVLRCGATDDLFYGENNVGIQSAQVILPAAGWFGARSGVGNYHFSSDVAGIYGTNEIIAALKASAQTAKAIYINDGPSTVVQNDGYNIASIANPAVGSWQYTMTETFTKASVVVASFHGSAVLDGYTITANASGSLITVLMNDNTGAAVDARHQLVVFNGD